jgi:hypothetical protein
MAAVRVASLIIEQGAVNDQPPQRQFEFAEELETLSRRRPATIHPPLKSSVGSPPDGQDHANVT